MGVLAYIIHELDVNYDGHSIFAHSRATALRGKFRSNISPRNLKPQKYCVRHVY